MWEDVCVTLLELGVLGSKAEVPVDYVSTSCGRGEATQLDLASCCVLDPYVHVASLSEARSAPVAGLGFAPACFFLIDHTNWVFAQIAMSLREPCMCS